jgi:hypothetical protein
VVRQNVEFGISVILKALREIAGRSVRPTRAAFVHARNSDQREFERFYGCFVEFGRAASEGASSDLLEFSNDALAIPLKLAGKDRSLASANSPPSILCAIGASSTALAQHSRAFFSAPRSTAVRQGSGGSAIATHR